MNDHSNSDRVRIILPASLGGGTVYAVRRVERTAEKTDHGRWSVVDHDGNPVSLFVGRSSPHLIDVRNWVKGTNMTTLSQTISRAASRIAGAAYDDAVGATVEARIEAVLSRRNLGTDGDLTSEDCNALELLLDAATGVTSDLYDSDTADVIREATAAEAIESALAGPEGHILVDGRRCYVSL